MYIGTRPLWAISRASLLVSFVLTPAAIDSQKKATNAMQAQKHTGHRVFEVAHSCAALIASLSYCSIPPDVRLAMKYIMGLDQCVMLFWLASQTSMR